MGWLQTLAAEFQITLADGTVWLSIGQGLLIGGVCLVFGVWVARFVGLLDADAPAGETLGVGLASGLLVLTSWWAALMSGGRSSFTPVAVGFAIAIGLAVVRRSRRADDAETRPDGSAEVEAPPPHTGRWRGVFLAVAGAAVFVVAMALLYGSTMAPRPRDGVQPIEFMDEAYYSILAADLATTGTETIYSPSGFDSIEGLPSQTWYHWGETWLAAAAIAIFGAAPLDAVHFVVLPLLLLAAATLTGTLVRQITGAPSRAAFLFGFVACLFLAPVPLIAGPYFSAWAVGMVFGITMYGLASVAVLLSMYALAVLGEKPANWALAAFVGSAAAAVLPAHVVIGLLALLGVGSVWALRIGQSLWATRRLPVVAPVWRRAWIAAGVVLVAAVGWGVLTGHGIGASGLSPSVSSFNASWRQSIAINVIGAGAFLAIPVAWLLVRRGLSIAAGLYLGTMVLVSAGAVAWGARLGDFTMFHVFFGGIAVFATPVAAIAVWSIWQRLRAAGRRRVAAALIVLCLLQVEFGAAHVITRLQTFGPGTYPPVPSTILDAIRDLPIGAKLAYACLPSEEIAFWDPRLLSLSAHSGRRIIPMCFQNERFGSLTGTKISQKIISPLFRSAPQRTLYPDSATDPSPAAVAEFMHANGIDYIYADKQHPNTLVPDAIPIATSGDTELLRLR